MIKNRNVQLLFQTIYCTLGVIGFLASLGLFDAEFNSDFYVYYTNLSNYICLGFMFASLVFTVKAANKKEDGACTLAPRFQVYVYDYDCGNLSCLQHSACKGQNAR